MELVLLVHYLCLLLLTQITAFTFKCIITIKGRKCISRLILPPIMQQGQATILPMILSLASTLTHQVLEHFMLQKELKVNKKRTL